MVGEACRGVQADKGDELSEKRASQEANYSP